MSQSDQLLDTLGSLTGLGTISRRQQLFIAICASSGRLDHLFTGTLTPAWQPDLDTSLHHQPRCEQREKVANSLVQITLKATQALCDLIPAAAPASSNQADRSRLQMVDYLYPMVASLLSTSLPHHQPSTNGYAPTSPLTATVASAVFQESPNQYFSFIQHFKGIFLSLLSSVGNASQTPAYYTLEIDNGTCINGQLTLAASILTKLVLCPLLGNALSSSTTSPAMNQELIHLRDVAVKLFGPKTSCKLSDLFCSFLQSSPRVATKVEGESPLLTTMKRIELGDLFAATSLCASNSLQILYASPLTAKCLVEHLRNQLPDSLLHNHAYGGSKAGGGAAQRVPLTQINETQDYNNHPHNGRLSSVAAEDDEDQVVSVRGATLSRTLDVTSGDVTSASSAAAVLSVERLLSASAESLLPVALIHPFFATTTSSSDTYTPIRNHFGDHHETQELPMEVSGYNTNTPPPSSLTQQSAASRSISAFSSRLSQQLSIDVSTFLGRCEAMSNDILVEGRGGGKSMVASSVRKSGGGASSQQELAATTVAAKCLYLASEQALFLSKMCAGMSHLLWCQSMLLDTVIDGAMNEDESSSPVKQRKVSATKLATITNAHKQDQGREGLVTFSAGIVVQLLSIVEACAVHIPSPSSALKECALDTAVASSPLTETANMHITSPQVLLSASLLPFLAAKAVEMHGYILASMNAPRGSMPLRKSMRHSCGGGGANVAESDGGDGPYYTHFGGGVENDMMSSQAPILLLAAVSAGYRLNQRPISHRGPQTTSNTSTGTWGSHILATGADCVKILGVFCNDRQLPTPHDVSKLLISTSSLSRHAVLAAAVCASVRPDGGAVQSWLRQQIVTSSSIITSKQSTTTLRSRQASSSTTQSSVSKEPTEFLAKLSHSFIIGLLLGDTTSSERLHDMLIRRSARLTIPAIMADYDGPLHEVGFLTQGTGTPARNNTTNGNHAKFSELEDDVYYNGMPEGRPSERLPLGGGGLSSSRQGSSFVGGGHHQQGKGHTTNSFVNPSDMKGGNGGDVHECVATLQSLLGNLQLHAANHDDTTRELNHYKALAAQREEEIRRMKQVHSQEVNAFKNDASALSEKIKRVKAEALDEAARHASELARAMKVLEDREEANEQLRKDNASLVTKLRRQETRTQQILGMLQQSDSQEHN